MSTRSGPDAHESRDALYIDELREFFATGGLPFGSPEDIVALADRLREPGTFSDDLSSLVRSIVLRQGGDMPHAQLLEILSLAIAGPEPAQDPDRFREPLRQLLGFVGGVMRRPWNAPPGGPESAEVVPFPTDARTSEPAARAVFEQIRAAQIREEQIRGSRSKPSSRIGASPVPGLYASLSYPVPQTAKAATGNVAKSPWSWTPTRRDLLLGAPGVVALVAVLILMLRPRQPQEVLHAGSAPTNATAAYAAAQPYSPPIQPNSAQSAPRQPAVQPQPPGNSRPASTAPSSPSPVSPALVAAKGNESPAAAPIVRHPSHSDPDASIVGDLPASQTRSRPTATRFNVTAGVMAAYLISSPDPDYPKPARIAHVEGQVILQAVVAKDGSVSSVRALRGDRLLRKAAEDAVSRWRYRPFRLGGQPIDVATIVTVDFHDRN